MTKERINELPDKISESGYDSLTPQEKAELRIPEEHVEPITDEEKGSLAFDMVNKLLGKRHEECGYDKRDKLRMEFYEKNHHHVMNLYTSNIKNGFILEVPRKLYTMIWDSLPQKENIKADIEMALRKWCFISDAAHLEYILVENIK